MADRVQRFLWDNEILKSATVLSATATQAGAPLGFLRDPLRSKALRTPVGWTVYAGFNDDIDFTEAGVARVGTIVASTYATGATYATAVQTAMNAAPGATNIYTVTYDAGTKIFTIARATGTDALVLKCAAGAANFASSAYLDLGFLDTDRTGLTSYVGDISVYQSRHALFADLSASAFVQCSAVAVGGVLSVFTVQGSGSTLVGVGARATVSAEQALTTSGLIAITFAFADTLRYWRLIIDSRVQSQGYSEVPVWFVGDYLQLSRAFIQGNSRQAEMLTDTLRGDQGAIYRNPKNAPKRHVVQYRRLTTTDRASYQGMEDGSLGDHLFFVMDALNSPQTNTVYGVLEGPADIISTVGDGSPPDRHDLGFAFLEDLG